MFPQGLTGAVLLLMRAACALVIAVTLCLSASLPLWSRASALILAGGVLTGL